MLPKLHNYITTIILNIKHWVDENKKKVSLILLFLLGFCLFYGFYMRVPGLLFLLTYINLKDNEILKNLKRNFENYETIKNFKNTWASDKEAMAYHRKHDFPFLTKVIEVSYYVGAVFLIVWFFYDINFYFKISMLFILTVILLIDFFISIYIIWFCNPFTAYKGLATSAVATRAAAAVLTVAGFDQSMAIDVNPGSNAYNRTIPRIQMPDGTYIGGRGYGLENNHAIDHDKHASIMMRSIPEFNVRQYSDPHGIVTESDINFEVRRNLIPLLQEDCRLNKEESRLTHKAFERFNVSEADFNYASKFRKVPKGFNYHPGESDL
jgi:hypothetical protein